jgi:hypothetical protein
MIKAADFSEHEKRMHARESESVQQVARQTAYFDVAVAIISEKIK